MNSFGQLIIRHDDDVYIYYISYITLHTGTVPSAHNRVFSMLSSTVDGCAYSEHDPGQRSTSNASVNYYIYLSTATTQHSFPKNFGYIFNNYLIFLSSYFAFIAFLGDMQTVKDFHFHFVNKKNCNLTTISLKMLISAIFSDNS